MPSFTRSACLAAAAAVVATLVVAVVVPAGPAHAAPITVGTTADNTTFDGNCSLREAIANANGDSPANADCPAGDGADVITLPAGTITLTSALPSISDAAGVTIDGAGMASTTIDANNTGRPFDVQVGGVLALEDLKISNGSATGDGGAVLALGATTLTNVELDGNDASGMGGGVAVGAPGSLSISGSTIAGGFADSGGGIYVLGATVTITNTWIHGNDADPDHGGAIRIDGSTAAVSITGSAIGPDNTADSLGGAILNNGGTLTIDRSALFGNSTSIIGSGGAIFHDGSNALTVTNSTISGNSADGGGGIALFHDTTTAVIASTTIAGNTADVDGSDNAFDDGGGIQTSAGEAPTVIRNSIIGDNTDASPVTKHADCSGTFTSQGYNLLESTTGCTRTGAAASTDITGQTPRLNALSSYTAVGQTPPSHSLQSTSPASDAGNPNTPGGAAPACPNRDQAGAWRPYDGPDAGAVPRCDIGAREGGVPVVTVNDVRRTEGDSGTANLTFTLRRNAPFPASSSVAWATADGSARAGADYRARSGTATFTGTALTRTVSVPVIGDLRDEYDERFFVNLSGAVNLRVRDNKGVGTILDDDPPPRLRVLDATVSEPDAGATAKLLFEVRLNRRSGKTVKVDFRTVEGSAISPEDFAAKSGTLRFEPGRVKKVVRVPVQPDTLAEGSEQMRLKLSDPRRARLADDVAVGTILD